MRALLRIGDFKASQQFDLHCRFFTNWSEIGNGEEKVSTWHSVAQHTFDCNGRK